MADLYLCIDIRVSMLCLFMHTTADILDEISPRLEEYGLSYDCIGGGRIEHNSNKKTIFVYGYSMASGPV